MIKRPETGTVVYGASDDLIEIDGEIRDEFDSYDCKDGRIAFSDGTLLGVEYDQDGLWRLKLVYKGELFDRIEFGTVEEDTNDEAYFKEGLKWCVFSDEMQVGKA